MSFPAIALTIIGKPTSKKTSQRQIHAKSRVIPIPSAKYVAYEKSALMQLRVAHHAPSVDEPCHLTARFYRDNRTDIDNMLGGLLDILQKANVIKNDRCVKSSFLWKSGKCDGNPRVEVFIVPYEVPKVNK